MAIVVTFRAPEPLLSAALDGYGTPSLGDPALKEGVLRLIRAALDDGLPPVELSPDEESAPARRINLSLADALARPISVLAKKHGASEGAICRRLLFSLQRKGAAFTSATAQLPTPAPIAEFLAAWNAAHPHKPMQPRHPQSRFFNYLIDALSGSSIGLCEAATGTGKTLAMLLAARDRLQQSPESRVLIAVPTVAVMRQFVETYREMEGVGMEMPAIRTILGRRAFVSVKKIREIIEEGLANMDARVVEEWVTAGGAPVGAIELPWLIHSLKIIAPDFPADAACLPDAPDIDEPGLVAYQRQFHICEEEPTAEIILSTHAMLAIDTRNRLRESAKDEDVREASAVLGAMRKQAANTKDAEEKKALWKEYFRERDALTSLRAEATADIGKLPAWHYLMVDEAHQMEQNFSSALSNYVSLSAFVSACKKHAGHGLPHSKLKTILSNMEIIRAAGMDEENVWLNTPGSAQRAIGAALREIADAVSGIGKRRIKKANADLNPENLRGLEQTALRIQREAEVVRQAAEASLGTTSGTAFVSFSPVRVFPQIHVGSKSVASQLSFTWATARAGAAVSATLYLPKGEGYSAWYQKTLLSIHDSRAKEYPPVAPPWVFTQVEAIYLPPPEPIIPTGENVPRLVLRPPARSDRLDPDTRLSAENIWLGDLAKTLRGIYATANGGVLVLMTSYDSAKRLGELLANDLKESLIVASTDTGVEKQKRRYLDVAKNGGRPIWLGVGAAWTGLDLSGKLIGLQPHQDEVLTDLVIPRVPFGSNRSLTHAYRMKNDPAVSWEVIDAAFMQKQGMGRLIRNEGLPSKRRIWILDNRMNDPRNKLNLAFKLVKSLMAGYNQLTFTFNDIGQDMKADRHGSKTIRKIK